MDSDGFLILEHTHDHRVKIAREVPMCLEVFNKEVGIKHKSYESTCASDSVITDVSHFVIILICVAHFLGLILTNMGTHHIRSITLNNT